MFRPYIIPSTKPNDAPRVKCNERPTILSLLIRQCSPHFRRAFSGISDLNQERCLAGRLHKRCALCGQSALASHRSRDLATNPPQKGLRIESLTIMTLVFYVGISNPKDNLPCSVIGSIVSILPHFFLNHSSHFRARSRMNIRCQETVQMSCNRPKAKHRLNKDHGQIFLWCCPCFELFFTAGVNVCLINDTCRAFNVFFMILIPGFFTATRITCLTRSAPLALRLLAGQESFIFLSIFIQFFPQAFCTYSARGMSNYRSTKFQTLN